VKRPFGTLLAAMLFVSAGIHGISSAVAQDWPNKPVRIVNTFAPGGAADYLARTIADGLSTTFGQQFFVETRSGAAGAIGVNSVVATPPDGYNFVITNITMLVLAPISNPRLGYHPERDLTNLAYLGGSPVVLSVNSKSSVKSLADFIAHGK
jgi:tripartite-type tricarboxylate transporter receptor subunit TctC